MNGHGDLRLLLLALRERLVDPVLLARVGADWSPAAHPSFLHYLVERGVLSGDQFQRLEGVEAGTRTHDADAEEHPPTRSGPLAPPHADGSTDSTASANPGTPATPVASTAADPVTPSDSSWDTPVAPGNPAPAPAVPGGRYRVRRLHQVGGLGQVWVAEDTALGREVAVKTIRPERAGDAAARARFVDEARVTGRLEHPCIVPLYDLVTGGERGAGPCYAMRFIAGRTLAKATTAYHADRAAGRADPLALAALLDALVSVCRAVAFAHSRGVLHRDLKGQNVVLGDFGEVFLVDWGLAHALGGPPDRAGALVGTPGFIAPEVAAGGAPTTAADVYGLGAILYTILTGCPPYHTGTPVERVQQAVDADPPPPRAVNPAAPPALESVCAKALARDPAARYPSAGDLAVELRRFLADEPVAAYREPWTVRAARWVRRHRTAATAAAAALVTAVVALSAGTVAVWRERERTVEQKRLAESEWVRAEAEAGRAEQNFATARTLAFDLGGRINQIETGQRDPKFADEARRQALNAAREQFDRFRAARPDDAGLQAQAATLHRFAANLSRFLTKTEADAEAAAGAYAAAVGIWEDLAARFPNEPAYRDNLAETLRDRAGLERRMGKLTTAAATLDRSLELAEGPRGALPASSTHRTLGTTELERADVAHARGRFDDAARCAGRAVELLDRLKTAPPAEQKTYDPLLAAMGVHLVAVAHRDRGRTDEALAAHDDAVARMKALAGPKAGRDERFWDCQVRHERARTAAAVPAQRAAAADDLAEVIRAAERLVEEHPQVPVYREGLASAYLRSGELLALLGRSEPAAADLTKSLTASRELLDRHGNTSAALLVRGETFLALGRLHAAVGNGAEAATQWKNAARVFQVGLKLDPENVHHRRGLAEAEQSLKPAAK